MATAWIMTPDPVAQQRDAFLESVLEAAGGAFKIFSMYLGDRLGFYAAMRDAGPMTAGDLAIRTGTHPRYVREWLEQQTVNGILTVENPEAPAPLRRYTLPVGHDEVLADSSSLNYLAPLAQVLARATQPLERVVEAYRTGEGVPFEAYGCDLVEGQARMNRAAFLTELGAKWIPTMPDVDARLWSAEPARVADFGCGWGYSAVGLATSYPNVRVDGFDLDTVSIERAKDIAREAGVADRVTFQVRDAADPDLAGEYDLVMAMECVHDMTDPVGALETMRRLLRPGGTVLIMDERVGDPFTPEGTDVERLMYGFSILHCLPVGMCGERPEGTGTVMRSSTLRDYAQRAGFTRVETLPIDNFFFRFYRLYAANA